MRRAVVVMGRLPKAGRVKTRLAADVGAEQACTLYTSFLKDVFEVVRRARALIEFSPCFSCALFEGEDLSSARELAPEAFSVYPQQGATLGDRIEDARARAKAEHVVVIGSDAPTMRPQRIEEAFVALESERVDAVVGPTRDGGYDLIAFSRQLSALLRDVPWSTSKVFETTQLRAHEAGLHLKTLDLGFDIDTVDDLAAVLDAAGESEEIAQASVRSIRTILRAYGSQKG